MGVPRPPHLLPHLMDLHRLATLHHTARLVVSTHTPGTIRGAGHGSGDDHDDDECGSDENYSNDDVSADDDGWGRFARGAPSPNQPSLRCRRTRHASDGMPAQAGSPESPFYYKPSAVAACALTVFRTAAPFPPQDGLAPTHTPQAQSGGMSVMRKSPFLLHGYSSFRPEHGLTPLAPTRSCEVLAQAGLPGLGQGRGMTQSWECSRKRGFHGHPSTWYTTLQLSPPAQAGASPTPAFDWTAVPSASQPELSYASL